MGDETRVVVQEMLRRGDLSAAQSVCLQQADGADPYYLLTLARIHFVRGQAGAALQCLSRLRRLTLDWQTLVGMGTLYLELHRDDRARRCYEEAARLDAKALQPHQKLFEFHQARGDATLAEQHLQAVLQRFPHSQWARQEQAGLWFEAGRWDEARALYAEVPNAFCAHACAEIFLRQGREEEALLWYRRAAARGAEMPWPHYRAAVLAARRGQVAEALRWLQSAPAYGTALDGLLARLHDRADNPAAADQVRANSLPQPSLYPLYARRLRELAAGKCLLHSYKGRDTWSRIRLRVVECGAVGHVARRVVGEIMAFHEREFGSAMQLISWERSGCSLDYAYCENAIMHESFPSLCRDLGVRRRRPGEMMLILLDSTAPLSRGIGGYGHAAVECAAGDIYLPAVAAHEFYHASLALYHTDGDKDVLDACGLMGKPGGLGLLSDTYVHFRQKAHCAVPRTAQRYVGRGHRADEDRDWDTAASNYRKALTRDPLHLWAAARLAQVEVHRGRYHEAVEVLAGLLRMDGAAEYSVQMAHLQAALGRMAEAEATLNQARGYSSSERTHMLAGMMWEREWYYPRAQREFHRALAIDPQSWEARACLGGIAHARGRWQEALRRYEAAVRHDPNWSEAYDALALWWAQQGDIRQGLRYLRRAGGLKPRQSSHYYNTARIRCLQGRWQEVPTVLGRALEDKPNSLRCMLLKGYAHLLLGERADALAELEKCRDTEWRSPYGRVAAAWVRVLRREHDGQALWWMRRLYRRDEFQAPLLHVLALLEEGAAAQWAWQRLQALEPRLILPKAYKSLLRPR